MSRFDAALPLSVFSLNTLSVAIGQPGSSQYTPRMKGIKGSKVHVSMGYSIEKSGVNQLPNIKWGPFDPFLCRYIRAYAVLACSKS